jgi:trigger factor
MAEPRITLEDLTPVRKRLRVEIPAEAVSAELDRAFGEVGRHARLRGFRPGKAPRAVVEKMFGDQVRREVLGRLVEESFHHAVSEHKLDVVGTPDIDADTLDMAQGITYSAVIDVRPTITIGNLDGIQVARPSDAVGDDDVARVLERLRESVGQLRPIEDRHVVEAGDVVTVDLTSRLDDNEPMHREDVLLEAGGGTFPAALERQLVGQAVGAHVPLTVAYPADYGNPGLAGKTVHFEVDVKAIRAKELPPLDDDFARDHGRSESLDELRAKVRADLEREAKERADAVVREAVLGELVGRHTFDVPRSLVERRAEAMLQGLDVRGAEGPDRERALGELRAQLEPRAENQVRAELLLDAIAERDGIAVSDAEVSAEANALAARERQVNERVRAFYERPETRAALRARLLRDRALARVLAGARIMPLSASESVAHEK